ncbi:putative leucine-rich repeat domain superfamily [Helianthus anomalus]
MFKSCLIYNLISIEVSTHGAELSVLEQTFNRPSERKMMTNRCKLFYAIYQVLLVHEGPINEFTLCMPVDGSCVEIDHIIRHLSKKKTVKILKLDFNGSYRLPVSLFSFHQLTELYLNGCVLDHQPSSIGFGSLTSYNLKHARNMDM